jgi:phospholipid/cholesterol/gamma-HCH transport system substrate-binding protein
MAKQIINNIKLGGFVLAGLLFLILILYMIGRNRNLFGANFILKVRVENVQGLKPGNNVRFGGIDVGTVKQIDFINDTAMEIVMTIDDKAKNIIRKNALASIATDGLVGNKVLLINSAKKPSALVEDGDELVSKKPIDTDDMLRTLNKTNIDVGFIAENLKTATNRINNSQALWSILSENELPQNLKLSVYHVRLAATKANDMVNDLYTIVHNIKNGGGSLGAILTDTTIAYNLNAAVIKIKMVGDQADLLSQQLSDMVSGMQLDINNGKGIVNALLKDSGIVIKLNNSLDNVEKGTDGFNQNMEALKHNFLFRGYFKKLEKEKKEESKKVQTVSDQN